MNKIKHFKGVIQSGSKFHITIGHETIIAKIELFKSYDQQETDHFDFGKEYIYLNEYNSEDNSKIFALIDFTNEHELSSVLCVNNSLLIGSKLDADIHLNQCRIAFYGRVQHAFSNKYFKEPSSSFQLDIFHLSNLKVFKEKSKEGVVERKQLV